MLDETLGETLNKTVNETFDETTHETLEETWGKMFRAPIYETDDDGGNGEKRTGKPHKYTA